MAEKLIGLKSSLAEKLIRLKKSSLAEKNKVKTHWLKNS